MNVDDAIPVDLLRAYSQAELSRREIAAQLGRPVSFGGLLAQLQAHRLPLPRVPSDPDSRGVRLIHELAARAARHGG